jgi:hypothetical protein
LQQNGLYRKLTEMQRTWLYSLSLQTVWKN